jgi:hypothetical protein
LVNRIWCAEEKQLGFLFACHEPFKVPAMVSPPDATMALTVPLTL